MKKAVLCFVAFLSISSFIGCTDTTDEEIRTVYQIDPADDGTIDEDDHREGDD